MQSVQVDRFFGMLFMKVDHARFIPGLDGAHPDLSDRGPIECFFGIEAGRSNSEGRRGRVEEVGLHRLFLSE